MWFGEPHPFPERGSPTRLSASGQQSYEGWSCRTNTGIWDKFVGTRTHSQLASHTCHFRHFSGPSSTHKSTSGPLPFSRTGPAVPTNHRSAYSDQSQTTQQSGGPNKNRSRRPEKPVSTPTAEDVLATKCYCKCNLTVQPNDENKMLIIGVLCS